MEQRGMEDRHVQVHSCITSRSDIVGGSCISGVCGGGDGGSGCRVGD